MLHTLKRHPFGVEAFFRRSLVLTYAVPEQVLGELVGPGLQIDAYDEWGFVAIALVQTQGLRPRGFPRWLGRDFFLSGYRIFTRLLRPGQPTLRGLRILRSDTDCRVMVSMGNLFTQYKYSLARVEVVSGAAQLAIRIRTPDREADLDVTADLGGPAPLPAGSPFRSLEDARDFAGPLPFTFSYDPQIGKMVVVKGLRKAWDPQPVRVEVREATYLSRPPFARADVRLANAFYLENVPYAWKPGVLMDIP